MERLLPWLIFVLIVLVCCWFKPQATRIFLGCFFIAMGIGFHLVLILRDPHGYDGFSTTAFLPLYRWGFREVVMAYPLAFAITAAVFEILVGLLMLSKRQYVRLGCLLGTLFLLASTPLGIETLPNALLALGTAYLATKMFPRSLWDVVRSRGHRSSTSS